jgi:hypothetical protein
MVTHNSANRVAGYVNECAAESKHMVEEYPVASVALSFGIGVLAGFALVTLLSDDSHRRVPHRLGSHILHSLAKVFPEQMTHPFRS